MGSGSRTKRRIALLLQYDGTEYNGWQVQAKGVTIQDLIEKALEIISKETIRVTASGRTDAGVHALGQIAHFDITSELSLQKLAGSLNGILPRNIAVKNVYEVPADFHSRFSAREREYVYHIYNSAARSPFMMNRAMWVNFPLDKLFFNASLACLVGEKNFASFCKKTSAEDGTIRKILFAEAEMNNELLEVKIRGTAFLHNMIRIIIGTVVDNFRHGRDPEWMHEIIASEEREAAGPTAPASGLYLNNVRYDPPLKSFPSAF